MNILVLGSGGREHALSWKIRQSSHCSDLFVAPGNGGTAEIATNLNLDIKDFEAVADAVKEYQIDMLIVGPEDPLVLGIQNFLADKLPELIVIGPDRDAAQLEGSKDFAKQFMNRYNIPTARAKVFNTDSLKEGYKFLESLQPPYVLKADGLAAGKGVIITSDLDEARATLEDLIINKKFGEASTNVLIEEFLEGIELSVFVLTDGKSYCILPEAKDYKRIGEGDTGPNTGGMGCISPVRFADRVFMEKVEERIIKPTIEGIKKEGFNYKGFIFIGLMNKANEPFVIEYNVRMGDPETEVVMPRLQSDLVELFSMTSQQRLSEVTVQVSPFTAATVMLVSEGYPGSYEKGREIHNEAAGQGILKFHAGTRSEKGRLLTNGGRVIAVTALGKNMVEALSKSYEGIGTINWKGMTFRKDIGEDLKKLGQ